MKQIFPIFLLLMTFSVAGHPQTKKIRSIYTNLAEKYSRTIKDEPWYHGECPGPAGYKLELVGGDAREDLIIISPPGQRGGLNFFENVSPAFSWFGEKAEWRVPREGKMIKPQALIVRFYLNEADQPYKTKSYLVIIKITTDSCITDVVKPMKNQNLKARQPADQAAQKNCLVSKTE